MESQVEGGGRHHSAATATAFPGNAPPGLKAGGGVGWAERWQAAGGRVLETKESSIIWERPLARTRRRPGWEA